VDTFRTLWLAPPPDARAAFEQPTDSATRAWSGWVGTSSGSWAADSRRPTRWLGPGTPRLPAGGATHTRLGGIERRSQLCNDAPSPLHGPEMAIPGGPCVDVLTTLATSWKLAVGLYIQIVPSSVASHTRHRRWPIVARVSRRVRHPPRGPDWAPRWRAAPWAGSCAGRCLHGVPGWRGQVAVG